MKDESDLLPQLVDNQVVELVDQYIDGTLSDDDKVSLEKRLEEDEVQTYFVERLHFHAEMLESQQPIRVEMSQRRDIIFEVNGGIPKVTKRETKEARVGNPRTEKYVDLVRASGNTKWAMVAVCVSVSFLVLTLLMMKYGGQAKSPVHSSSPVLVIRNASFEDNDLAEDEDGTSYSIFDWQDHFMTQRSRVIRVASFRDGEEAADGDNAAYLTNGSFVTQRLLLSDKSELKARKGMRLKLTGMVRRLDQDRASTLLCALRVVRGIHPEMLQYEPADEIIEVESVEWTPFEVIFQLPSDSLEFWPSDGSEAIKEKGGKWDVDGKALTLSLDHRGQGAFLLDSIHLEVLEE